MAELAPALLAILSIGIFAAHALEALGDSEMRGRKSPRSWRERPEVERAMKASKLAAS
jgi:hypothetical protein